MTTQILAYLTYRTMPRPRSSSTKRTENLVNLMNQGTKRMMGNHNQKMNMKKARHRKTQNNHYHYTHVFPWNAFSTERM